ncbi:hypothetical protein AVEN_222920-1 [Araneus ventricosus]|uniref:Uncharacterized protein n=1 Tax=Araneus ventricosus TaxID=182803 RepID=A0A4Y2MPF3_ARAVE|nr:hypothetical protein AVEN_222920-1 [Araneus ventricosus]
MLGQLLTDHNKHVNVVAIQSFSKPDGLGSLVIFTSHFEVTRGLFGTDLVILNSGQLTRTTPELPPPLEASTSHQREEVCPPTYDLACNRIFSGIGFRTWTPSDTLPLYPGCLARADFIFMVSP